MIYLIDISVFSVVALRAQVLSALRAASSRPGPPSATGLRPLHSGALVLGGAPPPACVFSAPGHSCSGALRPWPTGSPLHNCRARKVYATGRSSRPRLRLFLRSALLRSAPSGRRLRRPLRARAPTFRVLRPQAPDGPVRLPAARRAAPSADL